MKPVYDNTYWLTKQERKKLQAPRPVKKNIFSRLAAYFMGSEEDKAEESKKHKRTRKQRLIRRSKHRDRMRNAA